MVAFATSSSYAWSLMVHANSEGRPGYGDIQFMVTEIPAGHRFFLVVDCAGTIKYPAVSIASGPGIWLEVRNDDRAIVANYPASSSDLTIFLYAETEKWSARAYGGY